MRSKFAKLQKQLRKNFPETDLKIVRNAYRKADEVHKGQTRLSGDPFVIHSLAVAQNLAQLGLDPVTCAAGLLHDALEDTPMTLEELSREFGDEIASLVDGVTKISGLSFRKDVTSHEAKQAQNIRKMLVATAKDVRVIVIKLADRLHNIATLEYLPKEKRDRIARETLDIYAPLAHRLGISHWKWELEDYAFHILMPEAYRETARQVAVKRRVRESELHETIHFLEERLAEAEVNARVIGRPKHLYSIHQKMLQQGKSFDEILDVQAVRIITQMEAGCYNALGVVHSLWTPIPGRLKDYIAMPKLNMYQAIHTSVMRDNGRAMEVQIRTEDMDRTARQGIAAHWSYKEGKKHEDKRLDSQLAWLRQMYEWLKDAHAPEELMDSMRKDFTISYSYVFSPKGEVKELPRGATPLDFAYLVHSDVGHHCIGARVNGRMVPLRYHLQTGDVVEILTSKNQTPHLDWIDIIVTGRARTRIRQRLRELGTLPPIGDRDIKSKDSPSSPSLRTRTTQKQKAHVDHTTREKLIRIEGTKGMATQFAKCCNPMPGQAVLGYVTRNPGVTVHRAECKNFAKSARDPARMIEASWAGEGQFEAAYRVSVGQRPNALADITSALRPMNIDIVRAQFGPGEDGKSFFDFVFAASDRNTVDLIGRTLRNVTGVTSVVDLDIRESSQLLDAKSHVDQPLTKAG